MVPSLDIFRIESGGVLWREAVTTIETAKARIQELALSSPGNYLIVNQKTGERITVMPGSTAPNRTSECRIRPSWPASWYGLKNRVVSARRALRVFGKPKLSPE
jgi:hypothetical protein